MLGILHETIIAISLLSNATTSKKTLPGFHLSTYLAGAIQLPCSTQLRLATGLRILQTFASNQSLTIPLMPNVCQKEQLVCLAVF